MKRLFAWAALVLAADLRGENLAAKLKEIFDY
jgi:hypothetical protein